MSPPSSCSEVSGQNTKEAQHRYGLQQLVRRLVTRTEDTWARAACLVGGALIGVAYPSVAGASPLTAVVVVERRPDTANCPNSAELTHQVELILQRSLADPSTGDVQIRVEVQFRREQDEYVAEVRFRGPKPGERILHDPGPGCEALSDAVGVAIGLVLDRELSPAKMADIPSPPPRTTGTAASERDGTPVAPSGSTLGGLLEGGFWGLGDAFAPRLGGDLELRVRNPWLLGAGIAATWPTVTRFSGGRVRTSLLIGMLRACSVRGDRSFVGACLSVGVGRLRGVGVGYDEVSADNLLWLGIAPGVVAEAPVRRRLFWGGFAELWVPLRHYTFSVERAGIAWESSPLAVSAGLRLGVRAR